MWCLRTGQSLHVLEGHTARVTSVSVASKGSTAITAADDFTARVWSWATGECLCAPFQAALILCQGTDVLRSLSLYA